MKNQTFLRALNMLFFSLFVISAPIMTGCSDDPESVNEEEVITTVTVTLTQKVGVGEVAHVVTLNWDDTNLDGIVDASEVITSGPLMLDELYDASIQMINKSANPEVVITDEVKAEAEEHIFCFAVTAVGISITNLDEDKNGLPLGLTSTWAATSVSTGTVNITLRHQPGVKTGDCPGAGDTDADITFTVRVEDLIED